MVVLPIKQAISPRFSYSIALNNVIFNMYFYWNTRLTSWFLDISDSQEKLLLAAIRIVPNYSLLAQCRAITGLPNGILIVLDTENNLNTGGIDFDNFGKRYLLEFLTPGEV